MSRRRWTKVIGLVVGCAIAGGGCKDEPTPTAAGEAEAGRSAGKRRAPDRLEPVRLGSIGARPGYLDQGPVYAAVEAGRAQAFLREIPLPSEVIRDLARARQDLGFDPLNDDVLARFAIPPDAVISMTLGRPIGREHLDAIRTGLRRDNRFLTAVSGVLQAHDAKGELGHEPPITEVARPELEILERSSTATVEAIVPAEAIEDAGEPQQLPPAELDEPPPRPPPEILGEIGEIGEIPYDPGPTPMSPGERREIDQLLAHADATALQFRFHVPSDDPDEIFGEIRARVSPRDLADADPYCKGLEVELCISGGRELLIVRRDGKAAVFDVLIFGRRDGPVDARRAVVTEAMQAPPARLDALDEMKGHASVYFDAAGWVSAVELASITSAVRSLSWSGDSPRSGVDRRLRETDAIRQLMDTTRIFDGLVANVHHERDRTQLQAHWRLADGRKELAASALSPPALRVPVPSLDALCDDALLCARSRGVPAPQRLGTTLALGIYGNADALDDALDDTDEAGAMLLLLATWPNALGTATWQLPLSEARGPEAALVRGLIDAVARVQGLGLSVSRLDVGRRSFTADYAIYARVPASDLSLVGTLLAMVEQRLSPTTVEGIEGEVMMLRVPEGDVPAVLMTREDTELVKNDEGKEIRHGWLALVDRPERLAWLLELPTDEGAEPMLHFEIGDLWRLISSVPEAIDDLGFARTWATDRSFKAALVLDDGQPRVTMEVALRPKKAAKGG